MKDTLSAMPEDPCHEKLNFREQIDIFPPFPYNDNRDREIYRKYCPPTAGGL